MKQVLLVAFAFTTMLGFMAPTYSANILLEETFETYVDQTEFSGVWSLSGSPPHVLDTTFGQASNQSLQLVAQAGGAGVTNRWYRDLAEPVTASDAQPVVFGFDFYLAPDGSASTWAADWQLVDLRAFSGGGFGQGTLNGLVALGVARSASASVDTLDITSFQGRIVAPEQGAQTYYSLNELPTAVGRTTGWHRLEASIGATQTLFSIDGLPAELVNVGISAPFSTIVLGSDISSEQDYWVDNITLQVVVPEPATITPSLLFFALMISRRETYSRRPT